MTNFNGLGSSMTEVTTYSGGYAHLFVNSNNQAWVAFKDSQGNAITSQQVTGYTPSDAKLVAGGTGGVFVVFTVNGNPYLSSVYQTGGTSTPGFMNNQIFCNGASVSYVDISA